jgi:hypothetical protein
LGQSQLLGKKGIEPYVGISPLNITGEMDRFSPLFVIEGLSFSRRNLNGTFLYVSGIGIRRISYPDYDHLFAR